MALSRFLSGRVFRIYLLLIMAGLFGLIFYEKGSMVLWFNERHSGFLDFFFKYITHLGDGVMYGLLILFFIATRYYRAILLFIVVIAQTIPVQLIKRFAFETNPRPKAYFQGMEDVSLNFVEGVKIHTSMSFPSGHTATAFAIAIFLMYFIKSRLLQALLLLLAVLVAFSRIYLHLHFLVDVWAGAIIGALSAILVLWIFENKFTGLKEIPSLHAGLLKSRNS